MKKGPFLVGGIILLFMLFIGFFAVLSLTRYEKQRDLNNWQITLSIAADSRVAEIMKWADTRFAVLQELAMNGSLQLYVEQLLKNPDTTPETEAIQLSYLRNLIQTTGQRSGFFDDPKTNMTAPANIAFDANNGLILLTPEAVIITSTPGASAPDNILREAIKKVISTGRQQFYPIHLNDNAQPIAGFIVPVFSVQKSGSSRVPVAVLYGYCNAASSLFPILTNKNLITKTTESYLVRQEGNLLIYISPLADGTPPLTLKLAANSEKVAAASALKEPGQFGEGIDYAGRKILFTSRTLSSLQMIFLQKISYSEALSESQSHQKFLFISLILALLLFIAMMVAAWWHGSSIKEHQVAHDLLMKSRQLMAQTNLLNAINDNMSELILLLDAKLTLIFTNKTLAHMLKSSVKDLLGKNLIHIFGSDTAETLHKIINRMVASKHTATSEIVYTIDEKKHIFIVTCTPVIYDSNVDNAILLTMNNVTQLQEVQSRKNQLMQQIVCSLMRAIDLHDPYSANHSAKTALLATAIGRAMRLSPEELTTIEIAANLCNLGKLSIPKEILLKTDKLTPDEHDILKKETGSAAEILSGIEFDGPVLATIMQKHEYLDGSGYPAGLKAKDIILTARILAAANAFVAMTSPRAYRDRLTAKEAMMLLLEASEKKYDRHVIGALFHIVENEIKFSEHNFF